MQSVGARFAHGEMTLEEAAENLCRACASPGGGCQFLGTAATSQVVGEALGMTLDACGAGAVRTPDLARHGAAVGPRGAGDGARGITHARHPYRARVHNAMTVHAAFGGSTNLILHLPAIAHAAGLPRPTAEDWIDDQPADSAYGRLRCRTGRRGIRPRRSSWRAACRR